MTAHADAEQHERPIKGQPARSGAEHCQQRIRDGCTKETAKNQVPRAEKTIEHTTEVGNYPVAQHELNHPRTRPHRIVAEELHGVLGEVEQNDEEQLTDYYRTET